MEMYDALVRTAAERQIRISEPSHKRAINQCVDIWENLFKMRIRQNLFMGETSVAPDILSRLFLDTSCKFGKTINLIERVTSRESYVSKLILLDDVKKFLNSHLISPFEIP
jgi:hypothetical protein